MENIHNKLNFVFQAKKRMVKLIQKIIEEKREKKMSIINEDVADVLVNDKSEELTDELISDNMIDLMIPGEDSVPVLITLAVKYLSDSPLALQQLMVRVLSYYVLTFEVESNPMSVERGETNPRG